MRAIVITALVLFAGVPTTLAQTRDPSDRMLGPEMSRDRSEGRIERLNENKELGDKARAEKPIEQPIQHKKKKANAYKKSQPASPEDKAK